jgi:hypothetical protein
MVAVVLTSHASPGVPVKPLREEKADQERGGKRSDGTGPSAGSRVAPGSRVATRRAGHSRPRRVRAVKSPARPGSRSGARLVVEQGRRRSARSTGPGAPEVRTTLKPQSQPVVPATTPASAPPTDARLPADPVPSAMSAVEPAGAALPEAQTVEIVIRGGRLRPSLDHVHADGGYLTLRVRSDAFVLVEVEGDDASWPVLPGIETAITLDTGSTEDFEVELARHGGLLILRPS